MTSNAASLRVELGDVHDFHGATATYRSPSIRPSSRHSPLAGKGPCELRSGLDRPAPNANGAVFQTRSLYLSSRQCGHEVTIARICVTPRLSRASSRRDHPPSAERLREDVPRRPTPRPSSRRVHHADPAGIFTCASRRPPRVLLELGLWLRNGRDPSTLRQHDRPCGRLRRSCPKPPSSRCRSSTNRRAHVEAPVRATLLDIYNDGSDGLVVLSEGLRRRTARAGRRSADPRCPRAVSSYVFDCPSRRRSESNPLEERGVGASGIRLLCAGRHARSRAGPRIRISAKHVLPSEPDAVLVLVGMGPDTGYYERVATEPGVQDRGLRRRGPLRRDARLLPICRHLRARVAQRNVRQRARRARSPSPACPRSPWPTAWTSSQIDDGVNGILVNPASPSDEAADAAFGAAVIRLARDPLLRKELGLKAVRCARDRHSPRSSKSASPSVSAARSATPRATREALT